MQHGSSRELGEAITQDPRDAEGCVFVLKTRNGLLAIVMAPATALEEERPTSNACRIFEGFRNAALKRSIDQFRCIFRRARRRHCEPIQTGPTN